MIQGELFHIFKYFTMALELPIRLQERLNTIAACFISQISLYLQATMLR